MHDLAGFLLPACAGLFLLRLLDRGLGFALRIREAARKHGVPIVENKPLAQTLYKTTEVGDTIPASLFSAVAEVLAYLVRIKQLMF